MTKRLIQLCAICLFLVWGFSAALAAPQARIVSLAPNLTEILFALGHGSQVVGVTRQCDFPTEAKQKPNVGDMTRPNIETILMLKPSLVLATEINPRDILLSLQKLGIEVLEVTPQKVTDVAPTIELIAKKLDSEAHAIKLASNIRKGIIDLDRKSDKRKSQIKNRAVVLLQINPPIAAGTNTWLGDLLERAGLFLCGCWRQV